MNTEIIEKLKKIISQYVDLEEVDISQLNETTHLINDLGLDSFYVIDIVLDIETEFEITIDDNSISNFETVQNVVTIIKEKLNR
jgi:acyl carrier protein